MSIAGHTVDTSDVIAAAAVFVSLLLYWQNRSIAADSRASAWAARESASTAREAVDNERRTSLLGRKACLTMATDKWQGGASYSHNIELGTLIEVHIRNEGMSPAYDISATLTYDGETRNTVWSVPKAIGAYEVTKFDFYFYQLQEYDDMPEGSDHIFEFRAHFRDGVGADTVTVRFKLQHSAHPQAEPGHPNWDASVLSDGHEVSALCQPLAAS